MSIGVLGLGGLLTLAGLYGLYNVHIAEHSEGVTYFVGIIESKLGGVLAMFGSLIVLFFLPWLDSSKVRSGNFRPMFKPFFWLFLVNAIFLGWMGAAPADGCFAKDSHACPMEIVTLENGDKVKSVATIWTNPLISQIATAYYFLYFLIFIKFQYKFIL